MGRLTDPEDGEDKEDEVGNTAFDPLIDGIASVSVAGALRPRGTSVTNVTGATWATWATSATSASGPKR